MSEIQPVKEAVVEDGFGNCWPKCPLPDCDLHVVRPGKVQCTNCDVGSLRAERQMLREVLDAFAEQAFHPRQQPDSPLVIPSDSPALEGLRRLRDLDMLSLPAPEDSDELEERAA